MPTRTRPAKSKAPSTPRIRELREARGLRPAALAATLDVDQSTLARWERGRTVRPPKHEQMRKLADLFDVSIAYLMGWES